jgi:hypothetical protein
MTEQQNKLHDAELTSVLFNRHARSVTLKFASPQGQHSLFRMEGLFHFRAIDILIQNVVSRVRVSANGDLDSDEIAGWIRWVTGFSDSPSFLTEDQLTTLKEQILQHERCLIVIEPSCGAELAAIARSYSVSTD